MSLTFCCFVVNSSRLFVLCLTLCYFVLVFSFLLALRLPRLGKRELILVLFVRLFDLCLFGFVGFLFLLLSGKDCGLWLWHSLDFSLTFCFRDIKKLNLYRYIRSSIGVIMTLSIPIIWLFADLCLMFYFIFFCLFFVCFCAQLSHKHTVLTRSLLFAYFPKSLLNLIARVGEAGLPSNAYFPWTPDFILSILKIYVWTQAFIQTLSINHDVTFIKQSNFNGSIIFGTMEIYSSRKHAYIIFIPLNPTSK